MFVSWAPGQGGGRIRGGLRTDSGIGTQKEGNEPGAFLPFASQSYFLMKPAEFLLPLLNIALSSYHTTTLPVSTTEEGRLYSMASKTNRALLMRSGSEDSDTYKTSCCDCTQATLVYGAR